MPIVFIGIPLLAVVILNIRSWKNPRAALWAVMAASVVQVFHALYVLYLCQIGRGPVVSHFFGTFSVDSFSAVVLFIIGMICAATVIVARESVKESRFSFGNAMLLIMMGMNGVVMVTDIFSLYVFIEVTSTSAFLLIAINKKREELEGAFKYYLMSALATAMMLIGITMLFALVGDTSFKALSAYIGQLNGQYPPALAVAFILITAALSIKSGAVPFHTWVPDAHSTAPSPVSVLMAGVVIKVSGVYALMRVYRDVFLCDRGVGNVLMALGILSVFIGALGAIGQKDIKRMLAFSSVSQIGYIVLGASTGSMIGLVGAVAHYFNHATFKSLLFVDAAAVLKQTGTRNMDEMGGLAKKMPFTGISSVIGLLSMAGIPPLSGFWSKLLIVIALWQVSPAVALAALLSSALTLSYFLILQKKVFFGQVPEKMANVTECAVSLRWVQVALSAVNVLTGILFPLLLVYFKGRGLI